MILRCAVGFFLWGALQVVVAAKPTRSAQPPHPVVEASDTAWAQWHTDYAEWMKEMLWYERNEVLAEHASRTTKEASAYDWRLEARLHGLSLQQIEALHTGGVVATGRSYLFGEKIEKPLHGIFVTSDMVLHAYNLMVADFVRSMEMQRAPKLRRILQAIWDDLPRWAGSHQVSPHRVKVAIAHAQRVVGPALLCMGTSLDFTDSEVARDCQEQVNRIVAADTIDLPHWLKPGDEDFLGIDYQRMKPVGFYPQDEILTGLFRAVRWLQAVPFRPDRENELVAFAILAELAEKHGLNADDQLQRQWLGFPNCLTVVGQKELNEAVVKALKSSDPVIDLEVARAVVAKMKEPVHANDNRRLDPKLLGKPDKLSPILKVVPAYLTADAMLFSEVLLDDPSSTRLPEGRMIMAFLGDRNAVSELAAAEWNPKVIEIIDKAAARQWAAWLGAGTTEPVVHPYDDSGTFNSLLLQTWAALFMPPAKGAPPFLSSPAWRAKSRNTVLSAWAEKKHTWVLHEVEPQGYTGSAGPPPPPPGLIEPNPEFFRRLRILAEKTIEWMVQNGCFSGGALDETAREAASEYLKVARYIHEQQLDTLGNANGKNYEEDLADRYGVIPRFIPSKPTWNSMKAEDFSRFRESMIKSAEAILLGLDPDSRAQDIAHPPAYRRERWGIFLDCLKKLEAMSARQLRQEPWTEEEAAYLTFGVWNDYHAVSAWGDNGQKPDPKSLGPKIAPVGMNPNTNEVLQVGTGDMAEIYVLYPWKGASFLYRGPIMPYYEFVSPKRLNDEEWRALLKSSNPPRQPAWLEPLWK